MDFAIGSIKVAALVIGIVQAAKGFGLTGKRGKQALALVTSVVLVGISHGITEGLVPSAYIPYITWGVTAIAGGLAAMGWYSFAKKYAMKFK